MHRYRSVLAVALASLIVAGATPVVLAKDGEARLDAPIPLETDPGSTVTVGWVAIASDGDNELPISGSPLFLRLISPSGTAVEAGGIERPAGSGHYVATLVVPAGGIARYEIGLQGNACTDGKCVRSDLMLAISGVPSGHPAPEPAVAAGGLTGAGRGASASTSGATAGPEASVPPLAVLLAVVATGIALIGGLTLSRRNRTGIAER